MQTAEIKASRRKGVVHMEKMKDIDFLDLLGELKDTNSSQFQLQNIPMTVKVDGLGLRIGKDANGQPFFESSSSGPIQQQGAFSAFAQAKGFTDPVQIERACHYDNLYNQVIRIVAYIDSQLGPEFLKDTKVHCEGLYVPMATRIGNKLKFVSVGYNRLPKDVKLGIVPLFVEVASTGESHPNNNEIKFQLNQLGTFDDTMFIDNTIVCDTSIDLSNIVSALGDINALRDLIVSNKRAAKQEAKLIIQPVKDQLAKFIVNHRNVIGKDRLGKDFEGIILYTGKGPIKITSPYFKDIMANKTRHFSNRPKEGQQCIVTGGSLVGHKGHMVLIDTVIALATAQNVDPYIYISSSVGDDDPIAAEIKLKTWQTLYPKFAHCFQIVTEGGSIMKKIEKELIFANGYNDVLLITGTDRVAGFEKWAAQLRKRLANPAFPENQNVMLHVNSRQDFSDTESEVRFTDLRNIIKDSTATEEQQLAAWCNGFDQEKLGQEWIKYLMTVSKDIMGIKNKRKLHET